MYWYPQAVFTAEQAHQRPFWGGFNEKRPALSLLFILNTVFANTCEFVMFVPICENTQQRRNAIPCRQIVDLCPELSCRPGW